MNRDNVLALAEFLEAETARPTFDVGFNMTSYVARVRPGEGETLDMSGHGCGTTACLAGWEAIRVEGRDSVVGGGGMPGRYIQVLAQESLGLNEIQSLTLFHVGPQGAFFRDIRPEAAIRCLRLLAETGVVEWDRAQAEADEARRARGDES